MMITPDSVVRVASGTFVESQAQAEVVLYNANTLRRVKISRSLYNLIRRFEDGRAIASAIPDAPPRRLYGVISRLCELGLLDCNGNLGSNNHSVRSVLSRVSPSCFRCPSRASDDRSAEVSAEVSFVGIPYDAGNTASPGARLGPRSFREASCAYEYREDITTGMALGWYSFDLDRRIAPNIRFCDFGDVRWDTNESASDYYQKLAFISRILFSRPTFPIFIGGDHSISYEIVSACDKYPSLAVIWLDAHNDAAPWSFGTTHHHGNVLTRIAELPHVGAIIVIGARGFRGFPGTAISEKIQCISPRRLRQNGPSSIQSYLPVGTRCYISLDIDVLDPSIAPATATPVPGGLAMNELVDVLTVIASHCSAVGMDVVEFSPELDIGRLSATVLSTICLQAIDLLVHGSSNAFSE